MSGADRRGPGRACRELALLLVLVTLGAAGCGGAADDGRTRTPATIERDTFVATWVDLRRAALGSAGGALDPADREAILAEHGVTEEDLLRFAEVHGDDLDYMRDVWSRVEERLGEGEEEEASSDTLS